MVTSYRAQIFLMYFDCMVQTDGVGCRVVLDLHAKVVLRRTQIADCELELDELAEELLLVGRAGANHIVDERADCC